MLLGLCASSTDSSEMRPETEGQSTVAHPGEQEAVEPPLSRPSFSCCGEELDGWQCLLPPCPISGTRPSASLSFPLSRVSATQLRPTAALLLPTTFPWSPRYLWVRTRCLCVFMLCLALLHVALQWRALKGWERSQLARTQSRCARMVTLRRLMRRGSRVSAPLSDSLSICSPHSDCVNRESHVKGHSSQRLLRRLRQPGSNPTSVFAQLVHVCFSFFFFLNPLAKYWSVAPVLFDNKVHRKHS